MRTLYLLPVLALVTTGLPAFAHQQTTPSATTGEENGTAPKPARPVKPRKICHEDESANSRMPTRICHTQAEWDAIAAKQRGNRDIPSRATH